MGRVRGIKPVTQVAAVAVAIVAENLLYRKMRQAGWQLRPVASSARCMKATCYCGGALRFTK